MRDRPLRVLIVGSGGIGGVIGSGLQDHGHDVTVLATNPAVRSALQEHGLRLDPPRRLRGGAQIFEALPDGIEPFDYVLLATQPPQVQAAARANAPFLAEHGKIVCFQNGLCEERVASVVGRDRVVGGVIAWGASMPEPGVYRRTAQGGFTLGTLSGAPDESLGPLASALGVVGPVSFTDNLAGVRWSKLAINCAVSTLGTLGGSRLGDILKHRRVRRLGLEILTEVLEVADAEGVYVEPIAGTVRLDRLSLKRPRRARKAVSLVGKHLVLVAVGMKYRRLRSSMLAAIERGREPAVNYLNGEVVDRAARHGVATPVNRAALDLVWAIADGQVRPSLQTLQALYEQTR